MNAALGQSKPGLVYCKQTWWVGRNFEYSMFYDIKKNSLGKCLLADQRKAMGQVSALCNNILDEYSSKEVQVKNDSQL